MNSSHGKQICVDYSGYDSTNERDGEWMLELLRSAVRFAEVREVHSHVEEFDGSQSPAGFAAVVLLDESHVSAHCYYDKGILAVDAFTCGDSDPKLIIEFINEKLFAEMGNIKIVSKDSIQRFRV